MSASIASRFFDGRERFTQVIWLVLAFSLLAALFFVQLHWQDVFWKLYVWLMVRAAMMLLAMCGVAGVLLLLKGPATIPLPAWRHWRAAYVVSIILVCLLFNYSVMQGFQGSGDEYAYLFQAKTYAAGRLWNDVPLLGYAQAPTWTWIVGGKWISQYSPGWPVMLALFEKLGLPWLANAIVIAATGLAVLYVVRERAGAQAAWLSGLLFAVAPFTLFNGAGLFAHPFAGLLAILSTLAAHQARIRGSTALALLAGAALGCLGLTRLMTAALVALTLVPDLLRGERPIARIIAFGLGGFPFALALLWYQYAITGDPLLPTYWAGGRTADHLYFDWASIKTGARNNVRSLIELSLWAGPVTVPLWGAAIVVLARARALRLPDLLLAFGLFMLIFYPLEPGNRYGPRYLYDFWPLAVVTIGSAAGVLSGRWLHAHRQAMIVTICYGVALLPFLMLWWQGVTRDRAEPFHLAQSIPGRAVLCATHDAGHHYTMWVNDMPRNGIDDTGRIMVLNCTKTTYGAIRTAYPDRAIWRYEWNARPGAGALVRVDGRGRIEESGRIL